MGPRARADKRAAASIVEAAAVSEPSSFGKKVLEKFGWQPGKGLGKDEQGISARLKVVKREESVGIGAETKPKPAQDEEWWLKAFESAANTIPVVTAAVPEKPRERSNTVESDDVPQIDDDELARMTPEDRELFIRCGGRRLSRRAGRDMPGKRKRLALADAAALSSDVVGKKPKPT